MAIQSPFATVRVDVGAVVDIERRIEADGQMLVDAEQLIAIVAWNPSTPYGDGTAANVYGPEGEGHPVTSATTGLMALVLRSTHLGCRVLRCGASGWYEDPCHGSKWNRWGEYTGGPTIASTCAEQRISTPGVRAPDSRLMGAPGLAS